MSNIDSYYFEKELSFFKEKSVSFAKNHPEIANALGINKDGIEDPEITRLVESVCLLNSHIQKRLDDDYSEFTESLLQVIYPDYLKPIPSYSQLSIEIDKKANAKSFIPKYTVFDVSDDSGNHCYYRTTYDLEIFPITLDVLNIYSAPFTAENFINDHKAKNIFEFVLKTTDPSLTMASMDLEKVDLTIRCDNNSTFRLYDEIKVKLVDVYIEANGKMHRIGPESISNPILEFNDTIVPYAPNSYTGLNLLREFFMFQDIFNHLRINLTKVKDLLVSDTFKIKIFLKEIDSEILHQIQKDDFNLYTVPIVNIYKSYSSPFEIDFMKDSYPLILNGNYGKQSLYSVEKIIDTSGYIRTEIPKLYDDTFESKGSSKRWFLSIEENEGNLDGSVKFIDTSHNVATDNVHNIVAEVMVTDGYRVSNINYTRVNIAPMNAISIPGTIKFLRRPSVQVNPRNDKKCNWDVIAHMRFNHISTINDHMTGEKLKKLLHLYNINDNRQNQIFIDSIKGIQIVEVVEPIRIHGKCCYVSGSKVTITLGTQELKEGIYIFAEFLDKFFSYFVNFNSFIQFNVVLDSSDDVFISFPRRMGCQTVL